MSDLRRLELIMSSMSKDFERLIVFIFEYRYGEEYSSPSPVVDMVTSYKVDDAPFVSFNFKYRPLGTFSMFALCPWLIL